MTYISTSDKQKYTLCSIIQCKTFCGLCQYIQRMKTNLLQCCIMRNVSRSRLKSFFQQLTKCSWASCNVFNLSKCNVLIWNLALNTSFLRLIRRIMKSRKRHVPITVFLGLIKSNKYLTQWGRVTHICVSKLTVIGSRNGLSHGRHQANIGINDGIFGQRDLRGSWYTQPHYSINLYFSEYLELIKW